MNSPRVVIFLELQKTRCLRLAISIFTVIIWFWVIKHEIRGSNTTHSIRLFFIYACYFYYSFFYQIKLGFYVSVLLIKLRWDFIYKNFRIHILAIFFIYFSVLSNLRNDFCRHGVEWHLDLPEHRDLLLKLKIREILHRQMTMAHSLTQDKSRTLANASSILSHEKNDEVALCIIQLLSFEFYSVVKLFSSGNSNIHATRP